MYFNDIHILYYVLIFIIGLIAGKFIDWCNYKLSHEEKILCKSLLKRKVFKPNYIIIFLTAFSYIALLYKFGISLNFMQNLDLIKFMFLVPMLLSVFTIDYKKQIIPNRLNLTIFEVGLFFTFLHGINNMNSAIDLLLGMLVGGGIFLLLTLIGGLLAGKEAMGFGDVKLMGALGLFFGVVNIIIITVLSFLLGAIISIILLIFKIKKSNEYIPFGPVIVISSILSIFVPSGILTFILFKIFTLGLYKG